jgi:transcriptional regulator with XRE-family HTH domain
MASLVPQQPDAARKETSRAQDTDAQIRRFAANLRRARTAAGMTQESLANACDLYRTYVSILEQGKTDPRMTMICRLAEALGVAPADLLGDGGESAQPR